MTAEKRDFHTLDCYERLESGEWKLLSVTEPLIKKKGTCTRKSICVQGMLIATLRFLATGISYEDMKFLNLKTRML